MATFYWTELYFCGDVCSKPNFLNDTLESESRNVGSWFSFENVVQIILSIEAKCSFMNQLSFSINFFFNWQNFSFLDSKKKWISSQYLFPTLNTKTRWYQLFLNSNNVYHQFCTIFKVIRTITKFALNHFKVFILLGNYPGFKCSNRIENNLDGSEVQKLKNTVSVKSFSIRYLTFWKLFSILSYLLNFYMIYINKKVQFLRFKSCFFSTFSCQKKKSKL